MCSCLAAHRAPSARDEGGVMTPLIERNTTSTALGGLLDRPDNPRPAVALLQGVRGWSAYNKKLGQFYLFGSPPAPRGLRAGRVRSTRTHVIINVSREGPTRRNGCRPMRRRLRLSRTRFDADDPEA